MRRLAVCAIVIGVTAYLFPAAPGLAVTPSRQEVGNLAAFARLYGVVRYFYPSDASASLDWDRVASLGVQKVRRVSSVTQLAAALKELVEPLGPGIEIAPHLPPAEPGRSRDEPLIAWRYRGAGVSGTSTTGPYRADRTTRDKWTSDGDGDAPSTPSGPTEAVKRERRLFIDFDLATGLKARVPIALTMSEAGVRAERTARLAALRTALTDLTSESSSPDVRLADVIVLWNALRHFYPYWTETGVDWDSRLEPQLAAAIDAPATMSHRDILRFVMADARDGHGSVVDATSGSPGWLPMQFGKVGEEVVVVASEVPAVSVGAVVTTIGESLARDLLAKQSALASGTTQWREVRALQELARCTRGVDVNIVTDTGRGAQPASLRCHASPPRRESRPAAVSHPRPGISYVDLTRARWADVEPVLPTLAQAAAVIFDVRGYPTDAGARVLPHLIGTPETTRWMHVARISGPFGQIDGWESYGWNLQPAGPRIRGKVIFLTDGRAISYAESVLGYVADLRLATIVGATTAGTNGNVVTVALPSGARVGFTGMRVTRHDGHSPFHLIGVIPDIPVAITLSGLREGRDEVLERALRLASDR